MPPLAAHVPPQGCNPGGSSPSPYCSSFKDLGRGGESLSHLCRRNLRYLKPANPRPGGRNPLPRLPPPLWLTMARARRMHRRDGLAWSPPVAAASVVAASSLLRAASSPSLPPPPAHLPRLGRLAQPGGGSHPLAKIPGSDAAAARSCSPRRSPAKGTWRRDCGSGSSSAEPVKGRGRKGGREGRRGNRPLRLGSPPTGALERGDPQGSQAELQKPRGGAWGSGCKPQFVRWREEGAPELVQRAFLP